VGGRVVVSGMRRFADRAGVQLEGCAALMVPKRGHCPGAQARTAANWDSWQTVAACGETQLEVAKAGGISVIVAAMKAHPQHQGVQEKACGSWAPAPPRGARDPL
jgi:hypothetical protein